MQAQLIRRSLGKSLEKAKVEEQAEDLLSSARHLDTMLREFRPDVLLLEPDLPGDWGTKLLEIMRNDPDVPCVPVVILTRNDHAAEHYPVREFYVKPLSMTLLAKTIRQTAAAAHT